MAKLKTGHDIINNLLKAGYSYRQLNECFDIPVSTLHNLARDPTRVESADTRELLNSKKPAEKPRWSKK